MATTMCAQRLAALPTRASAPRQALAAQRAPASAFTPFTAAAQPQQQRLSSFVCKVMHVGGSRSGLARRGVCAHVLTDSLLLVQAAASMVGESSVPAGYVA